MFSGKHSSGCRRQAVPSIPQTQSHSLCLCEVRMAEAIQRSIGYLVQHAWEPLARRYGRRQRDLTRSQEGEWANKESVVTCTAPARTSPRPSTNGNDSGIPLTAAQDISRVSYCASRSNPTPSRPPPPSSSSPPPEPSARRNAYRSLSRIPFGRTGPPRPFLPLPWYASLRRERGRKPDESPPRTRERRKRGSLVTS